MYAAALVWRGEDGRKLEVSQRDFGRWLWRVEWSVRVACMHSETGRGIFHERDIKQRLHTSDKC